MCLSGSEKRFTYEGHRSGAGISILFAVTTVVTNRVSTQEKSRFPVAISRQNYWAKSRQGSSDLELPYYLIAFNLALHVKKAVQFLTTTHDINLICHSTPRRFLKSKEHGEERKRAKSLKETDSH